MAGIFLIGYALISQDIMLQQDMEEYVDLAGQVQFPQPDPAKNAGSEGASEQIVTVETMEWHQNARDKDKKRSVPAFVTTDAPECAQQTASQDQGTTMVVVIPITNPSYNGHENSETNNHPSQHVQAGDCNLQRETRSSTSVLPEDQDTNAADHWGDETQASNPTVTASPESVTTPEPTVTPAPTPRIGKTGVDLDACKAQNSDFVAWLKIPGTKINYPVVWTDNVDYYLIHTFSGKESKLGTLFSLGKTDYKSPGRNIPIYGHHITTSGGNMFQPLMSYKKRSFWESHKSIYLDSLYHLGEYTVFAVINMQNGEWDPAAASFSGAQAFLNFVRRAKAQALYDTGVPLTIAFA